MKKNLFKRITALSVIIAILLSAWVTTAVFATNEGIILFSDDFNSLPVGEKVTVDSKDASRA